MNEFTIESPLKDRSVWQREVHQFGSRLGVKFQLYWRFSKMKSFLDKANMLCPAAGKASPVPPL